MAKIALFCKFWSVWWNVGFANVCNVCWLPKLSRRAEARGQNKIFIEAVIFLYWFSFYSVSGSFFNSTLQVTVGGMKRWGLRAIFLSSYTELDAGRMLV